MKPTPRGVPWNRGALFIFAISCVSLSVWPLITTQAAVCLHFLPSHIWHSSLCVCRPRMRTRRHVRTHGEKAAQNMLLHIYNTLKTVRGKMSLSFLKPCNRPSNSAALKTSQRTEHPSGRSRGVDKHNLLGNVSNLPAPKKPSPFVSCILYDSAWTF